MGVLIPMNIKEKKTGLCAIAILAVILFMAGCGSAKTDEPSKKLTLETNLGSTIGSLVEVFASDIIIVEGYALVGGLRGTGSTQCDPTIEQYLKKYILTQLPGQQGVKKFINRPNTAVVFVRGILPPMPLRMAPLRERSDDIPVLAKYFVERACAENGRPLMQLTGGALTMLVNHPWPGNIRELENSLERSVILNDGDVIDAAHLRLDNEGLLRTAKVSLDDSEVTLKEMEKELILRRLSVTGGNRTRAARLLGISVRTLRNKINQYRSEGVSIPA